MPRARIHKTYTFSDGYKPEFARYRPDDPPRNCAVDVNNVNFREGAASKRSGLNRFNPKPVGYTTIALFSVAEAWSNAIDDAVIYFEGGNSKKISIDNPVNLTTDLAVVKNLTGSGTGNDAIEFWAYFYDVLIPTTPQNPPHIKTIRLRLYTVVATDYYELVLDIDGDPNIISHIGWNKFSYTKSQFTVVGAPNWNNIVKLEFRFTKTITMAGVIVDCNLDNMLLAIGNNSILNIIDYIRKDGTQKILTRHGTVLSESITNNTDWNDVVT